MRVLLFLILSSCVLFAFQAFSPHVGLLGWAGLIVQDSMAVADSPKQSVDASGAKSVSKKSLVDNMVESVATEGDVDKVLKEELRHISESELSLLLDLSKRSKLLEGREALVQERENVLESSQSYIESRIKELKELQTRVELVLDGYKKEEDNKMRALVKIYENMKPQDAAQIFENLDMNTLLAVIERMRELKVAPILARMNIARAREVTVRLLKVGQGLMSFNNVCSCSVLRVEEEPEETRE